MMALSRGLPPRATQQLTRQFFHPHLQTSRSNVYAPPLHTSSLLNCTTTIARQCSTSATSFSDHCRTNSNTTGGGSEKANGINDVQMTINLADLRAARDGTLRARFAEKRAELKKLEKVKALCDEAAQRFPDRRMRQLLLFLIFQATVLFDWTYVHFDWNLVEPITYLLGYSATWLAILWYGFMQREFSYDTLRSVLINQQRRKLYAQHNFDIAYYGKVKVEVAKLEKVLRSLEPV